MDSEDPAPPLRFADIDARWRPGVLALNEGWVEKLSPLDAGALDALLAEADLGRVALLGGRLAGFVIVLREHRRYASPNYRWFAARFARFLYVDRVVVDAPFRGRGIAQALYAQVFDHARAAGVGTVACEYDVEPANPASARFHAAQGFREVGRQRLEGGKAVSLQIAEVDAGPAGGSTAPYAPA